MERYAIDAVNAIPLRDEAQARSRVYRLFSHLFRHGLMKEVLPIVQAIPELASLVPEPFDEDEAAADHYAVFSLDVFPYASLFLDADGRLGGLTTDAVQRHYTQGGLPYVIDHESADHLAQELSFLAFVAEAETEALEDDKAQEAARMRQRMRFFMDDHLLWWLPGFVQAMQQQAYPFYAALAQLTLEVVLDHRSTLGRESTSSERSMEEPPDLLADEKTGLKDIAVYLATPAWSGLFLSHSDMARLGRSERLPRGFGSRVQTLTNLLRAAVEFDQVDALLAILSEQVEIWKQFYQDLSQHPLKQLQTVSAFWLDRLATTDSIIERMRQGTRVLE